jgi:hypothetical protein
MELRATLKTRKLLILLNEKNDKNTGLAQLRYTPGTRPPVHSPLAAMVIVLRECLRTIAETCRSRVNAGHRDPPQFAKIIELVCGMQPEFVPQVWVRFYGPALPSSIIDAKR